MRCIFCKCNSDESKSVEHIVPESLGNKEHVLARGSICDSCNNYLACKVEKPVLDSPTFQLLRALQRIPNKRGRIPEIRLFDKMSPLPDYRLMGRFLGKIGLEALTARVSTVPGWNDELVNQAQLDELRAYVRFNQGADWLFAFRLLYPVNTVFCEKGMLFDVPHEFTLLYTERYEVYFVTAIFGVEFTINLGGPVLDGWTAWLEQNNGRSPLYPQDQSGTA